MAHDLQFHDVNCSIGLPMNAVPRPAPTADDLLREMDRSGVERALVWHVLQRDAAVPVGNELLAEAIRPHRDRLTGCWSILPTQTGEFPTPDELPERMAEAGVRALRAWPSECRFCLREEAVGDTLAEAEALRIPLILNAPMAVGWDTCYDLMRDFPELTLILSDSGLWGNDRYLRPLIDRYPRVHIDLTTYFLDGGIVDLVDFCGAERILFGTGFPRYDHGGVMLMVRQCGISAEDQAAIAGGNLDRLLEEADL